MICITNVVSKKRNNTEMVNINLKTDLSSHSVLNGVTFTVTYGTYTKSYTWNGSALTIEIPAYVEYTITFDGVTNYATPSPITYTALAGNARTLNIIYTILTETLTVNVTGLSSGFTISVINATTGEVIGSLGSASEVYNIPAGIAYYVTASTYSGYNTPDNSTTYTAIGNNIRSIIMAYTMVHAGTTSPTNGVWIQDTDGYFHTESAWDGSYTPNGIAVITSNCRFVMALENAYSSICQWGSSGTLVDGITTTTSSSDAAKDYDGEAQTTTILNQLGNSSSTSDAPAAYYCRAYKFPDGSTGYLGAAGEWQAALDNKAAVASALSKCGGTAMSNYYWMSTQYSSPSSWYMYWSNGGLAYDSKNRNNYVRAFAAI